MEINIHFFKITPRSLLLKIKNVSGKIVQEIKIHILCSVNFFSKMWKNSVERDRPQKTILRMRITCWILNTHNM